MVDRYSDTSMLSDEDKELVRQARAKFAAFKVLPPERRSKLGPRKQDFPIGIKPDGTVNRVHEDEQSEGRGDR